MAEIKSTMEMVLARAEKMCAAVDNPEDNSLMQKGMKDGATFVNGDPVDFQAEISQMNTSDQKKYSQGLLKTFLRNIALPRDETPSWEGALGGLSALAKAWPDPDLTDQLNNLFAEIRNILDFENFRESDLLFIEEEQPENISNIIQELCKSELPNNYGLDSIKQIQVLSPMYRGDAGVDNLNLRGL